LHILVSLLGRLFGLSLASVKFGLQSLVLILLFLVDAGRQKRHLLVKRVDQLVSHRRRQVRVNARNELLSLFSECSLVRKQIVSETRVGPRQIVLDVLLLSIFVLALSLA